MHFPALSGKACFQPETPLLVKTSHSGPPCTALPVCCIPAAGPAVHPVTQAVRGHPLPLLPPLILHSHCCLDLTLIPIQSSLFIAKGPGPPHLLLGLLPPPEKYF